MAMKRYMNITRYEKVQHEEYKALMSVLKKYDVHTQREVAELLGLSCQSWNNRLRGQRLKLTIAELQLLAHKLDMSKEDIAYVVNGAN